MARYHGGNSVRTGFYWNPANWEITTVSKKGGILPGAEELSYYRIPTPFILALGPTMGAVYVIFLPLVGFGLFFGFLGKKALPYLAKAAAYLTARTAREER